MHRSQAYLHVPVNVRRLVRSFVLDISNRSLSRLRTPVRLVLRLDASMSSSMIYGMQYLAGIMFKGPRVARNVWPLRTLGCVQL